MKTSCVLAMLLGCAIAFGVTLAAEPAAPIQSEPAKAEPTGASPAKAEAAKSAATETPAPPPSAETVELLDKMDAAGKDIKTVRARFDYELNQTLYEDIQKRKGELYFQSPNLLRFEFTDKPQETFVFEGRTLFHKKDATRQLIIWELRLPNEPPVESLELGKIPFPLPFGQRKDAMLKFFAASRNAKEEAADKDGRAVLALVPKKDTQLARDYTKILLWLDAKTYLPTRVRLFDTSENITTVDFHHIEINRDTDAKIFTRPDVPQDWEIVVHEKEPGTGARK